MRTFSRRRAMLAAAAAFALAAAGLAIAAPGPASTSLVSATFYANTLAKSHASTCTGANNDSYQVTDAIFTGTSTSTDTHLTGPLTIHVRSIYDATTNVGSLTADVRVGPTTPPHAETFRGRLVAVNVNGNVQGYLAGGEGGGVHVMGSVSTTFSAAGGFSSSAAQGTFGSGSGTNTAIVTSGSCKASPPNPPKPHVDRPKPTPPAPHAHHAKGPKGPKHH